MGQEASRYSDEDGEQRLGSTDGEDRQVDRHEGEREQRRKKKKSKKRRLSDLSSKSSVAGEDADATKTKKESNDVPHALAGATRTQTKPERKLEPEISHHSPEASATADDRNIVVTQSPDGGDGDTSRKKSKKRKQNTEVSLVTPEVPLPDSPAPEKKSNKRKRASTESEALKIGPIAAKSAQRAENVGGLKHLSEDAAPESTIPTTRLSPPGGGDQLGQERTKKAKKRKIKLEEDVLPKARIHAHQVDQSSLPSTDMMPSLDHDERDSSPQDDRKSSKRALRKERQSEKARLRVENSPSEIATPHAMQDTPMETKADVDQPIPDPESLDRDQQIDLKSSERARKTEQKRKQRRVKRETEERPAMELDQRGEADMDLQREGEPSAAPEPAPANAAPADERTVGRTSKAERKREKKRLREMAERQAAEASHIEEKHSKGQPGNGPSTVTEEAPAHVSHTNKPLADQDAKTARKKRKKQLKTEMVEQEAMDIGRVEERPTEPQQEEEPSIISGEPPLEALQVGEQPVEKTSKAPKKREKKRRREQEMAEALKRENHALLDAEEQFPAGTIAREAGSEVGVGPRDDGNADTDRVQEVTGTIVKKGPHANEDDEVEVPTEELGQVEETKEQRKARRREEKEAKRQRKAESKKLKAEAKLRMREEAGDQDLPESTADDVQDTTTGGEDASLQPLVDLESQPPPDPSPSPNLQADSIKSTLEGDLRDAHEAQQEDLDKTPGVVDLSASSASASAEMAVPQTPQPGSTSSLRSPQKSEASDTESVERPAALGTLPGTEEDQALEEDTGLASLASRLNAAEAEDSDEESVYASDKGNEGKLLASRLDAAEAEDDDTEDPASEEDEVADPPRTGIQREASVELGSGQDLNVRSVPSSPPPEPDLPGDESEIPESEYDDEDVVPTDTKEVDMVDAPIDSAPEESAEALPAVEPTEDRPAQEMTGLTNDPKSPVSKAVQVADTAPSSDEDEGKLLDIASKAVQQSLQSSQNREDARLFPNHMTDTPASELSRDVKFSQSELTPDMFFKILRTAADFLSDEPRNQYLHITAESLRFGQDEDPSLQEWLAQLAVSEIAFDRDSLVEHLMSVMSAPALPEAPKVNPENRGPEAEGNVPAIDAAKEPLATGAQSSDVEAVLDYLAQEVVRDTYHGFFYAMPMYWTQKICVELGIGIPGGKSVITVSDDEALEDQVLEVDKYGDRFVDRLTTPVPGDTATSGPPSATMPINDFASTQADIEDDTQLTIPTPKPGLRLQALDGDNAKDLQEAQMPDDMEQVEDNPATRDDSCEPEPRASPRAELARRQHSDHDALQLSEPLTRRGSKANSTSAGRQSKSPAVEIEMGEEDELFDFEGASREAEEDSAEQSEEDSGSDMDHPAFRSVADLGVGESLGFSKYGRVAIRISVTDSPAEQMFINQAKALTLQGLLCPRPMPPPKSARPRRRRISNEANPVHRRRRSVRTTIIEDTGSDKSQTGAIDVSGSSRQYVRPGDYLHADLDDVDMNLEDVTAMEGGMDGAMDGDASLDVPSEGPIPDAAILLAVADGSNDADFLRPELDEDLSDQRKVARAKGPRPPKPADGACPLCGDQTPIGTWRFDPVDRIWLDTKCMKRLQRQAARLLAKTPALGLPPKPKDGRCQSCTRGTSKWYVDGSKTKRICQSCFQAGVADVRRSEIGTGNPVKQGRKPAYCEFCGEKPDRWFSDYTGNYWICRPCSRTDRLLTKEDSTKPSLRKAMRKPEDGKCQRCSQTPARWYHEFSNSAEHWICEHCHQSKMRARRSSGRGAVEEPSAAYVDDVGDQGEDEEEGEGEEEATELAAAEDEVQQDDASEELGPEQAHVAETVAMDVAEG